MKINGRSVDELIAAVSASGTEFDVLRAGGDLAGAGEKLHAALVERWTWLDDNPDAPDYAERETQLIRWIHEYERIHRALAEATRKLGAIRRTVIAGSEFGQTGLALNAADDRRFR